ncbi:hypothetical protein ACQQ2T_15520 (plasmid) [Paraclostridium tenue]
MNHPKNSFQYQNSIASKASSEIYTFLKNRKNVIDVINIERNRNFQCNGVDLLCFKKELNTIKTQSIEIKADTHSNTNKYFLEVVGNDSTGVPGGIIYTIADYIFYYFIGIKELHVIERIYLQQWIYNNGNNLNYIDVPTVDKNNNFLYNTTGALVSRELLKNTIPIWIYDLNLNILKYKPDVKLLASGLLNFNANVTYMLHTQYIVHDYQI